MALTAPFSTFRPTQRGTSAYTEHKTKGVVGQDGFTRPGVADKGCKTSSKHHIPVARRVRYIPNWDKISIELSHLPEAAPDS